MRKLGLREVFHGPRLTQLVSRVGSKALAGNVRGRIAYD